MSLDSRVAPAGAPMEIAMYSLEPSLLQVTHAIPVSIRSTGDDFIATFFDASISASGETPEEAFANLRDMIIAGVRILESEDLGPELTRQRNVLRQFIKRD